MNHEQMERLRLLLRPINMRCRDSKERAQSDHRSK